MVKGNGDDVGIEHASIHATVFPLEVDDLARFDLLEDVGEFVGQGLVICCHGGPWRAADWGAAR